MLMLYMDRLVISEKITTQFVFLFIWAVNEISLTFKRNFIPADFYLTLYKIYVIINI
jgi:hypothetical protein